MNYLAKALPSILLIALFCQSCSSSTKQSEEASESKNSVSEVSCLAELVPKNEIEKMISAEQVSDIVGKSEDSMEYSVSKSSKSDYSTFGYEWKPQKKRVMTMEMKVGDRTLTQEIPLNNQIDIGNLEIIDAKNKTPLEYFTFVYGPKTKQQKEQAKKAIDRAKENNDKVDDKSAETIKAMVDKEKASNKLEGLGDAAYWTENNTKGMIYVVLRVLHKNTMFKITTDVSEDTEKDLEISKAIARQIIANCN